ncbi:hypothetical protein ABZ923_00375 [Streptomyces sp. NPDC046881]|uniref:hypothetical protein n=1 Tax=Streptomyces sp. NPDC046881 TaxID=3155374 RepID=UPI0033C4F397
MVDMALPAVDVTATVFVMDGDRINRRYLLAEARRHLTLVLGGRRRDPGLDDQSMATAVSAPCLNIRAEEPRPAPPPTPARRRQPGRSRRAK